MSTPNEIGSWYSTRTLVLTYIFIIWTKIGRGGHPGPPPRGITTPKIEKKCFGSCDISIESPWKALFKYVNWMLIWPLIWPSAAENDRKMTGKSFFYNCFFSGEHVHTKWDKKLIFYMDIGSDLYFHIMNQNWPGSTRDPPPRGVTTPKIKKTCFWSCDISIEIAWKALYKYVNWMLIWPLIWPSAAENNRKIVFLITVLLKGACPHRMR